MNESNHHDKNDEYNEHQHKAPRKTKPNVYMYVSIVLAILLIISFVYSPFSNNSNVNNNGVNNNNVKTIAKNQMNNYMETQLTKLFAGKATVSVKDVSEDKGMYVVNMTINGAQGQENVSSYVTKDGAYMFLQPLDLKHIPTVDSQQKPAPVEVPKSDKPKVELFVMAYCPYGLQAEKALLPVMPLLKDDADISIKYVSYSMHGDKEVYENLRDYCIQEQDQKEFIKYTTCFVEKSNYTTCLAQVNIDKDKLKTCMDENDLKYNITSNLKDKSTWVGRYPPFNIYKNLNELYGVKGSPTLVINGKQVNVNRSPQAYKEAICNAFNTKPSACDTKLSTNPTAPGFSALDAQSSNAIQASCN